MDGRSVTGPSDGDMRLKLIEDIWTSIFGNVHQFFTSFWFWQRVYPRRCGLIGLTQFVRGVYNGVAVSLKTIRQGNVQHQVGASRVGLRQCQGTKFKRQPVFNQRHGIGDRVHAGGVGVVARERSQVQGDMRDVFGLKVNFSVAQLRVEVLIGF